MKVKVYFFRLIIGLLAFGLGLGVYWAISGSEAVESEYPTCLNYPADIPVGEGNVVKEELPSNSVSTVTVMATDDIEKESVAEDNFYPGGDFYFIGDLPKGFKDFDYLSISTDDWDDKSRAYSK